MQYNIDRSRYKISVSGFGLFRALKILLQPLTTHEKIEGFLGFPIFSFEIPGNDNSHHKQEIVSSSATGLRLETSDPLVLNVVRVKILWKTSVFKLLHIQLSYMLCSWHKNRAKVSDFMIKKIIYH